MESIKSIQEPLGETTDVDVWLSRAGLKFADLSQDEASKAIRQQWREYQAAVHKCCVALHQPAEQVQLSGVYVKLRIPNHTYIKNDEGVLNS